MSKDTYSNWITGIVGTGIVAALGYLAIQDRQSIDDDIKGLKAHEEQMNAVIGTIKSDEAVAKVQHDYLVMSVNELNERQKRMDDKLDRILRK